MVKRVVAGKSYHQGTLQNGSAGVLYFINQTSYDTNLPLNVLYPCESSPVRVGLVWVQEIPVEFVE